MALQYKNNNSRTDFLTLTSYPNIVTIMNGSKVLLAQNSSNQLLNNMFEIPINLYISTPFGQPFTNLSVTVNFTLEQYNY